MQAWLRVALGYHTVAQVAVGWLVGSGSAAAWHAWGRRAALPAAEADPMLRACVYAATAGAVAFFAVANVLRWWREAKQQRVDPEYSSDWS